MYVLQNRNISIIWSSFLMKIVGLWLAADENEQRRRDFALFYTLGALFISICIALRDIYHTWGNFSDCVFISCNILYVMVVFFKISILYRHKVEFFNLLIFTQKNFWRPYHDPREILIVTGCKKICNICIILLIFCTQGTCAGYMVTPLIENIGRNESDRMLPFNLWVDLPVGVSPYFEILFAIQILCVYHVGICYICLDNLLCIVNLHVASQFRILQHRLSCLNDVIKNQIDNQESDEKYLSHCANICYGKLKNCVQQHQMLVEYCRKLETIFTVIVLGQVTFLAMIMCLVGFQLFLADTHASKKVSLVLNLSGVLCQLFMCTYSCDDVMQQSGNVSNAIFSIPWTIFPMGKAGTIVRRNLIIILMRSHKFCCLTAGKFFPVSLQTFTGVLSMSMSYFTLLRNTSLNATNS